MKTNSSNLEKFKELAKMFTIIFSLGQPMPVNYIGGCCILYINLDLFLEILRKCMRVFIFHCRTIRSRFCNISFGHN